MSYSNNHKESISLGAVSYNDQEDSYIYNGYGSISSSDVYINDGFANFQPYFVVEYLEESKIIEIENNEFFVPGDLISEYFADSPEDLDTISKSERHLGDYAYIVDGEYKGTTFCVNENKNWVISEV